MARPIGKAILAIRLLFLSTHRCAFISVPLPPAVLSSRPRRAVLAKQASLEQISVKQIARFGLSDQISLPESLGADFTQPSPWILLVFMDLREAN